MKSKPNRPRVGGMEERKWMGIGGMPRSSLHTFYGGGKLMDTGGKGGKGRTRGFSGEDRVGVVFGRWLGKKNYAVDQFLSSEGRHWAEEKTTRGEEQKKSFLIWVESKIGRGARGRGSSPVLAVMTLFLKETVRQEVCVRLFLLDFRKRRTEGGEERTRVKSRLLWTLMSKTGVHGGGNTPFEGDQEEGEMKGLGRKGREVT